MFSKIIFVLATLCVFNASLITANVFDDGVYEETFSDQEDTIFSKDALYTEFSTKPNRCHAKACNLVCRIFNNTNGACVDGRCKCANTIKAEDAPETEFETLSYKCYFKICDLVCRFFNNTSGACVDGRCKCEKSIKTEELLSNPEESITPKACNNQKCNQLCRKKKFRGGACVGANCYCHKFLSQEEDDYVSPSKCTHQECNVLCRRLKFHEGDCVAGRCRCNHYFPKAKDIKLAESFSLEDNFLNDNSLGIKDEVLENSLPVSELSEEQTERGCNLRACYQLCRRLKFPGGACVNGRCKCDNFFGTEDALDEYSESERRLCRLKKCNRTCTRRGYEGGRCSNGLCECYHKIPKDLSLEVTNVDQEDPNLAVKSDEEEEIVPQLRACTPMACNQMCKRLNSTGGWCISGVCRCF